MNAIVTYGGITYNKLSNSTSITYQHLYHRAPGFSGESVILSVLCVTLLITLTRARRKR